MSDDQPITTALPIDETPETETQTAEAQEVFGTKAAADYLGVSYRTLKDLIYEADPPLVPDLRIGPNRVFYKSTLDAWREERAKHMSTDDAAAYLGVERKDIYYYMHTMTPAEERLVPTGWRGDRPTFTAEALAPFVGRQKYDRWRRVNASEASKSAKPPDADDGAAWVKASGRLPGGPNDLLNRIMRAKAQAAAQPA